MNPTADKSKVPTPRRGRQRLLALWALVLVPFLCPVALSGESRNDLRPAVAGAAQLPTALIELDGTGSENPEGGEISYEWTQIEGPKVELSDPTAAKPYFRTGKPGLYRFQLVVTASGLKSEPFVVDILIERDNQPPVASAPEEVWGQVGQKIEIDASDSYDPEGDELTYRWRLLKGNLNIPREALNSSVLSFVPDQDGVYELELLVSDGKAVSRPVVTRMGIRPLPRPPVARAKAVPREIPTMPTPEQAMVPPAGAKPVAVITGPVVSKLGEHVILDARGSRGPSGNKLEYLWRQKSGPFINNFEMIFNGAAERFKPPRAGDYEFELVVSDGQRESEPAVIAIKVVNETDPPVAVVTAPARAMPGSLVKLDATQSYDMEGSPLVYRWRQTGGPKVTRYLVDEKLGDSAPAFHPPSAGIYSFELIVSNGKLQSKPVEVDIEVGDARRPPTLSIEGPEVAKTGERLVMTANAGNADGRRLSFVWRQVDGPTQAMPQTDGPRAAVMPTMAGRYVFDLSALEGGKIVATARRALEVFGQPANAPAIGALVPPAVQQPIPAMVQQPVPAAPPGRPAQPEAARPPRVDVPPVTNVAALEPLRPLTGLSQSDPLMPALPQAAAQQPPQQPSVPAVPQLTPLGDFPAVSPLPADFAQPAPFAPAPATQAAPSAASQALNQPNHMPRPVDAAANRPAAQIHPSTLGGGLYQFDDVQPLPAPPAPPAAAPR